MADILCLVGLIVSIVSILLILILCLMGKKAYVPLGLFGLGVIMVLGSGFITQEGTEPHVQTTSIGANKNQADISSGELDTQADVPAIGFDGTNIPTTDNLSGNDNSVLIFDALQYKFTDSVSGSFLTITEAELLESLGNPERVEEWNYNNGGGTTYPIRSLFYKNGNYVYEFNNNRLIRIQIFESISFDEKDNIPAMFGLAKTVNSKTTDTGVIYKVTNCGIHELQCTFGREENSIDIVFISYVDLFD